ncbi:HlyD family efflux transporter periplasmic adaptor subunit [Ferrimonas pelagia]|uniref:HlyD family efflux transporter periplasmic adaptor subunit n=1 Tax=Ferrimonas pelagia TaxID=1177826 RepID=A0ABP9ETH8_9GAMM
MGFAILVGLAGWLSGCAPAEQHVALGTLERERVTLPATVDEVIVALPVMAGTWVGQGTVLVQLDDRQQQAQVARALAEVERAEAQLDKLRNGARPEEVAAAQAQVTGTQATLQEAESSYARARQLQRQQLISQADVDHALASRDAASATLTAAREALLTLTNGTRQEDLRMAGAELAAAEASLASERKRLADLTLTAPRDGWLDSLPWNLGERVRSGSPLAVLLVGEQPYARVYVPQRYRVSVQVGDTLMVAVDGVAQPLQGRLRWIANEPAFTPYYALNQSERSRLMYLAEVALGEDAASLPSGVPAQVQLPEVQP